jgi:hypothetical protein
MVLSLTYLQVTAITSCSLCLLETRIRSNGEQVYGLVVFWYEDDFDSSRGSLIKEGISALYHAESAIEMHT